jgi:Tfp pilus assembly major pilin PilA
VSCGCGTEFAIDADKAPEIRQRDTPVPRERAPSGLQLGVQAAPPLVLDFEPKPDRSILPGILIGGLLACILGLGLVIAHAMSGGDEKKVERDAISRVEPPPSIERAPAEQMPANDPLERAEAVAGAGHDGVRPSDAEAKLPSVDSEQQPPAPDAKPEGAVEKSPGTGLEAAIANLRGNADDTRIAAAKRIAAMGESAVSASRELCRAMIDPSAVVRQAAGDALAAVNPSLYQPVNTILTDTSSRKAKSAFDALARMGEDAGASVDVLMAAIGTSPVIGKGASELLHSQPDVWVRTAATVGRRDRRVTNKLSDMLVTSTSAKVRAESALALSGAPDKVEAATVLVSALRTENNPVVALAIINAIRLIGPAANEVAGRTLEWIRRNSSNATLKKAANEALLGIGAN